MDKRTSLKIGLFWALLGVCSAVKIINLKVPSTYLLDQTSKTPDPLILDCEYEVDENEKGFVLKWLLDNQPVYQWIPSKNPFPFQSFKNRVDTSYVVSQEHMHKHRAMAIIKPLANFTGEYMCTVQTYSGIDRKSAKLKIIVRESKFDLSYYLNGDGYITVDCHARDISPLPKLQIRINDELFTTDNLKSVRGENGLYNASISGRIRKDQLESPATIECLLSIPETNYNKRRSTTYYESHLKTTTTTVATTTTVEMLQAAPENLMKKGSNMTDSNGASSLPVPLQTTTSLLATVVTILLIFATTLL
ncbi:uncharacterized protein LOC126577352 isoform X2 [Anopheles aquasalis]|uniref:uncharacterized protein LOC118464032 isoform X2 n=1 Tax=Anopheles albimanus TaxID=7167 RepID=UPI001640F3EA|nr:uncharacterized protein LOC118464032 isoform X2 [Anopheles albimanus]XP_049544665.1 uncharacterized protein LOC125956636 isoform X2 [Anopheles darlingi]XP_050094853.1 uncharacterized protein LOC126577352 isoform X2 [Anopheles aquasalis]